ncbi:MAG: segregation/condensation protein A [Candidatus Eremiobacteraeota bacterium]|nr:segregation/condensation protein A [Candidatus Eremiobacteraeota bacterium]MBC5828096.1 segregation/condensation protein A [Candidatus Eremiobacteraeota bacterium]
MRLGPSPAQGGYAAGGKNVWSSRRRVRNHPSLCRLGKGRFPIAIQASSPAARRGALLVQLDVFDGPLDLLLQLVVRQDIDIARVSLASVCEQYLAYLSLMEALDIEIAGDYLVIAATLVFIKSKRLLPPPPPPFTDELACEASDAEEALRERLNAYSHFKAAGSALRERFDRNSAYYPRPPPDAVGLTQRYMLDASTLAAAFRRVLENASAKPPVIKRDTYSVIVKMNWALAFVRRHGPLAFSELVAGCQTLEIIVTFVAILELIRQRKISFSQSHAFADITLAPAAKNHTEHLAESA